MFECIGGWKWRKVAVFASGGLFGTAGMKILGSEDAKKCYVKCLAAGLRAKDSVMTTATTIQENAEDAGVKRLIEEIPIGVEVTSRRSQTAE